MKHLYKSHINTTTKVRKKEIMEMHKNNLHISLWSSSRVLRDKVGDPIHNTILPSFFLFSTSIFSFHFFIFSYSFHYLLFFFFFLLFSLSFLFFFRCFLFLLPFSLSCIYFFFFPFIFFIFIFFLLSFFFSSYKDGFQSLKVSTLSRSHFLIEIG